MKKKTLLTLDDLVKFCSENKFYKFSSEETGYKLSVQVPASFEVDENVDDSHRGMMKLKVKIFHTGLNRNGSFVSEEAAKNAMPSIKNRPVLAAIHQLDDGTWDFESHNMEIIEDEEGNEEIVYIERQVGSFGEEEPFFEYDEGNQKNFVCAYAWISEEYTKAADIIRRKNGTKNSCELTIDELSFNAKDKYLDLEKFYVEASTLLGSKNDGTEIGEGMLGSRADIVDFSSEQNSVRNCCEDKLIETLDKLNDTLSKFNINNNAERKEDENQMTKFEELLEKYSKTAEDITFEYEGLSDEELEAAFAEAFEESSLEEVDTDFQKVFTISHEDIKSALYALLAPYEEADNDWYYISAVYDDYFAYEGWCNGSIYGQNYTKDGDNISFSGERFALHRELLTDSEYAELQSMRSNYASIKSELEKYQKADEEIRKNELFESDDYSSISDKKEFVELKANHDELSFEELTSKLDSLLLSYAKSGELKFSLETSGEGNKSQNKLPLMSSKKSGRYGNLFSKK